MSCNCRSRRGAAACTCPAPVIQVTQGGVAVGAPVTVNFGSTTNLPVPAGGGGPITETLTTLTFAGNVLTYTGENGVPTNINLAALAVDVGSLTFNPLTGVLTLTETDGTVHTVNVGPSAETVTTLSQPTPGVLSYVDEAGNTTSITVTVDCEQVQDCVGPALAATGLMAYDDTANSFTLPPGAVAGQVPVVNAAGTAVVFQTPASGSSPLSGAATTVTAAGVVNVDVDGTTVKVNGADQLTVDPCEVLKAGATGTATPQVATDKIMVIDAAGDCQVRTIPTRILVCADGETLIQTPGESAPAPNLVPNPGFSGATGATAPGTPFATGWISGVPNVAPGTHPGDTFQSVYSGPTQGYGAQGAPGVPFPGDPAFGVPAQPSFLYTNGNTTGAPYLVGQTTVPGLTPNTDYVFVAYISNLYNSNNQSQFADMRILVDGVLVGNANVQNQPADGSWVRFEIPFTTGSGPNPGVLEIWNDNLGLWGNDTAITSIGIQEASPASPSTFTDLSGSPVPAPASFTVGACVDCEQVQDCVGPFIADTGLFVYDDAGNQLDLPAGAIAGQVPTVNAAGTALVFQTPSGSLPAIPATITASGSVALVQDCTTGLPEWGRVVDRLSFATVTASGALSTATADVHIITGGTAFTLPTPTACGPNQLWVKNTSALAIDITPATGLIDGAAIFPIPAAGGIGAGPNGQKTIHFAFDGTNWQVL